MPDKFYIQARVPSRDGNKEGEWTIHFFHHSKDRKEVLDELARRGMDIQEHREIEWQARPIKEATRDNVIPGNA